MIGGLPPRLRAAVAAAATSLRLKRKSAARWCRAHPRLLALVALLALALLYLADRLPYSLPPGSDDDRRRSNLGSTLLRSQAYRWNKAKFAASERKAWAAWLANVKDYNAADLGVVPGSRGVVLTGPSKSVPMIIMATLLLRETGCTLPVQFSYLRHEVTDTDLEIVRKFNISTRDFTDAVKDNDWGKEEYRLGGPKVDSILASPFEQVLFLDPDNFVLRDPTFLFETKTFKKYGALFWPDFTIRKRESELIVWDLMGLKGKYVPELEFESGQIVLDKSKVWKGLMMAKYLSQQAGYYFQQFLGDKEAFFWGFAATHTPYFLNPGYIHSVGAKVDAAHPAGDNAVDLSKKGSFFCGQSMLQNDFYDDPDQPPPADFSPKPLFMHWNMLKYRYTLGVDYFQAAMTYEVPRGSRFADFAGVAFHWYGDVGEFASCLDLSPAKGANVRVWSWNDQYPNKAQTFHRNWQIAYDAVAAARYQSFKKRLGSQKYTPSPARGSRGVVLFQPRKNLRNAARAALALRQTGCQLPIFYMHEKHHDMKDSEVEYLRTFEITSVDYRNATKGHSWNDEELNSGGTAVAALLAAPVEEIVFLETETFLLADPTHLLDSVEYHQHGALFWPGTVRRRNVGADDGGQPSGVKAVLNVTEDQLAAAVGDTAFKSGLFAVSKPKAWKALKTAEFLGFEATYYFRHMNGYSAALAHAFVATQTPFLITPGALALVGYTPRPARNPAARSTPPPSPPPPPPFCGQSVLLHDLPRSSSAASSPAPPEPLPLALDLPFLRNRPDQDPARLAVAVGAPPQPQQQQQQRRRPEIVRTPAVVEMRRGKLAVVDPAECLVWKTEAPAAAAASDAAWDWRSQQHPPPPAAARALAAVQQLLAPRPSAAPLVSVVALALVGLAAVAACRFCWRRRRHHRGGADGKDGNGNGDSGGGGGRGGVVGV